MRYTIILALALIATVLSAQNIQSRVIDHESGERILVHEVIVPASLEDVWQAYTTKEGLESWAVPQCEINFRSGGVMKIRYELDGRIGDVNTVVNFIVNFVPWKMITLHSPLGKRFPEEVRKESPNMFTIVEFQSIDEDRTLLTAYATGFLKGEVWDSTLQFFQEGNEQAYRMLIDRFEKGPVDWEQLLKR